MDLTGITLAEEAIMLSLLDIAERAANGQKVDENSWNMGLFN